MTLSLGFYLYYLGWLLPSKREISPSYFPSLNLPHKQTWWVLLNRIRRTSRSGVSPSQGLPNLFPSRIHKSWRPTLNPQQHHCCLVLCWNQEPGNSYSQQSMQNQIKNYFSPICCLSHSLLLKFGLHSLAIIILNDLHFSTLGLKGVKNPSGSWAQGWLRWNSWGGPTFVKHTTFPDFEQPEVSQYLPTYNAPLTST